MLCYRICANNDSKRAKNIIRHYEYHVCNYDDSSYLSTSPLPWHVGHSPTVSSPCDSAFGSCVTGNLPEPLQVGQVVFMIYYTPQQP